MDLLHGGVNNLTTTTTTFTTTTPPSNSSWTPIEPDPGKCNYYLVRNRTEIIKFTNPYGGIPQNLLINVVGWFLLVLLFAVIRRAAGNYGRLALIRRDDDESKWTQIFYSQRDDEGGGGVDNDESHETDSITTTDYSEVDQGFFSWIFTIFTLKDDMIFRKCGIDALQYMKFQRHLIVFMMIITFICLTIILPINFNMGDIQGDKTSFGHTTISNLPGGHKVLWVHILVGIFFMPVGIYIMRKFSVTLRMEDDHENSVSSRTLMLDRVPLNFCKKDYIIRHFQEAYPPFEIDDVQIAFSVSKLSSLSKKLDTAQRAVVYCDNYERRYGGKKLMTTSHSCGLLCYCCSSSRVEAGDFYRQEVAELNSSIEQEKVELESKAIGVAFVTFSNLTDAKRVYKDHSRVFRCLKRGQPALSSLDIDPQNWDVKFAPSPDDIYWENLNKKRHFRVIKVWIINIIMFLVLFFFTSPAYIISLLETIPFLNTKDIENDLNINLPSYITDFLPTLLLWTLSALLPVMVAYSDFWLGHWRRSVENLWIMRKVFGYLLFMVLVLPSIGLTTIRAFVERMIKKEDPIDGSINWNCIFLPDNGAFFINYITTSALIGTGLEILRFPELFMYAMRLCFARSQAEISSVRKKVVYEFYYGVNYGWMLLIFALTVSYSVICPLITPFGLFYMVMKHGVDRHNIYFAYKRSKINKNIHGCAINCVMISLLIQQLILLFFNTVRTQKKGLLPPRAIFSITMFAIFCLLFLVQMFFHIFKGISPIQYTPRPSQHNGEGTQQVRFGSSNKQFVPDVLRVSSSREHV